MHYREVWKQSTGLTIPTDWHVHHIDGDHENSVPENLECVSAYVHWCIHFLQGDPIALHGKFVQGAVAASMKATRLKGPAHQFFGKKRPEHSIKMKAVMKEVVKTRTTEHWNKLHESWKRTTKDRPIHSKPWCVRQGEKEFTILNLKDFCRTNSLSYRKLVYGQSDRGYIAQKVAA